MAVKNNLELWNKVEKTNPNYTKKANVKGNNITSIAPQFQIMNATEQFGVYGVTWGFKNMDIDYTLMGLGLVTFKATFYFPNGEFETINSVSLWRDNAKTKIDDNFAKKLETDTLTKSLSKLGFNADIFLGKFDDDRYLEEVKKEFSEPPKKPTEEINLAVEEISLCTSLEELGKVWTKHRNLQKWKEVLAAKDERKKLLADG